MTFKPIKLRKRRCSECDLTHAGLFDKDCINALKNEVKKLGTYISQLELLIARIKYSHVDLPDKYGCLICSLTTKALRKIKEK